MSGSPFGMYGQHIIVIRREMTICLLRDRVRPGRRKEKRALSSIVHGREGDRTQATWEDVLKTITRISTLAARAVRSL